ncbi:hypothetical protein [Rhizobium sp. CC-YZS058]|uniref:hypothetical protein n=1 Tax=Rhizobium sp. CC-YZS058 TaxID=3042153 RepID=UPI003A4C7F20
MISSSELARISELGRVAGAVNLAQASECPYSHNTPDERFAWLAGFSIGRAEAAKLFDESSQASMLARHDNTRMTPFGSKVVYHHGANTVAVTYLGETRVLGPFPNEDAAHLEAAEAIADWRQASNT